MKDKKQFVTALKTMLKRKKVLNTTDFLTTITVALFALMYVIGLVVFHKQGFGKMQTFLNMLIDNAGLLIAASGMTIVMITGGIDISVGSVVGLVCMMLSFYMEKLGMPCGVAILLVLVFGVVFGAFQGWLVSYMEIQPFIVTLAGLFMCRGITAMISSDQIAIKSNKAFLALAKTDIKFFLGSTVNKRGVRLYPIIHPSVIFALITVVVVWYILKHTRFGRNIFAIGGNEQSALLLGINVKRTKFLAYVLEGFLASFAGFVFCLNTTSGFVEQARGFEMEAISSAVIGGTLLTGGVGTVIGTFFGVLIKATIETLIRFQGTLSSWWNKIVLSSILCFFIVLQSVFTILKARKKN